MTFVAEDISFRVGRHEILHDVSFSLAEQDRLVLLGATGSGKSVLLRLLAGIDRPTSGRILENGTDITQKSIKKRSVAFVYQKYINYPNLTVFENIASPLRQQRPKIAKSEIDRRVRESAKLLRIEAFLDRKPGQLSGGQQQRTAIARALVKEADYVFLDEPLVNLDYKLQEEMRGELKRIFSSSQSTLVYATSNSIDALSIGSHIAFLDQGRVAQFGKAREVYNHPNTINVGRYFSLPTMNFVNIDEAGKPMTDDGREVVLGIRPENLKAGKGSEKSISFSTKIELAEVVGSEMELHLSAGEHPLIMTVRGIQAYDQGDSLEVHVANEDIFVYDAAGGQLIRKGW